MLSALILNTRNYPATMVIITTDRNIRGAQAAGPFVLGACRALTVAIQRIGGILPYGVLTYM